jgi:hypothetical protein
MQKIDQITLINCLGKFELEEVRQLAAESNCVATEPSLTAKKEDLSLH